MTETTTTIVAVDHGYGISAERDVETPGVFGAGPSHMRVPLTVGDMDTDEAAALVLAVGDLLAARTTDDRATRTRRPTRDAEAILRRRYDYREGDAGLFDLDLRREWGKEGIDGTGAIAKAKRTIAAAWPDLYRMLDAKAGA